MVAIPTKMSWRHTCVGIVDDNAEWRRTLRAMCITMGAIDIVDAQDGTIFLSAAQNFGRGFDLLLVDDEMQPMDGFMLLRHLRAAVTHPSRRAAAILMPSNADTDVLRRALLAGFHGVIPKPFSAQSMAERAERILSLPMTWQENGGFITPVMPKQG